MSIGRTTFYFRSGEATSRSEMARRVRDYMDLARWRQPITCIAAFPDNPEVIIARKTFKPHDVTELTSWSQTMNDIGLQVSFPIPGLRHAPWGAK
jgi:hypothetical protein